MACAELCWRVWVVPKIRGPARSKVIRRLLIDFESNLSDGIELVLARYDFLAVICGMGLIEDAHMCVCVEASEAITMIRGEVSLDAALNHKHSSNDNTCFAHGVERVGEECMVLPQLARHKWERFIPWGFEDASTTRARERLTPPLVGAHSLVPLGRVGR